jgi:hypothetical protein
MALADTTGFLRRLARTPVAALPEELPDGGYSETAPLASLDIGKVVAFIDRAVR